MQASPSKARAHALESHSWSLVLSWLSDLYHPLPLPTFERNTTTLKALQTLLAENIAADRLQQLLFDAQCEELALDEKSESQRQETAPNADRLLAQLEDSLSEPTHASLESLASSAVLLGCCPPSSPSSSGSQILQRLASQILHLARQSLNLENHIISVEHLTSDLEVQTTQAIQSLATCRQRKASPGGPKDSRPSTPQSPDEPAADYSHLHAQILQNQRESKQLHLKAVEYQARIDGLEHQLASTQSTSSQIPSTATMFSKQQTLESKKERVKELEATFKVFHGLPPDIEASRREVQRAQGELDALKRRRDELFERM